MIDHLPFLFFWNSFASFNFLNDLREHEWSVSSPEGNQSDCKRRSYFFSSASMVWNYVYNVSHSFSNLCTFLIQHQCVILINDKTCRHLRLQFTKTQVLVLQKKKHDCNRQFSRRASFQTALSFCKKVPRENCRRVAGLSVSFDLKFSAFYFFPVEKGRYGNQPSRLADFFWEILYLDKFQFVFLPSFFWINSPAVVNKKVVKHNKTEVPFACSTQQKTHLSIFYCNLLRCALPYRLPCPPPFPRITP